MNNIYNQKIYKDKLFEELKTILGDSEKFKKFNKKRREVITDKLKELTILAEYSALFLSEVTKVPESHKEFEIFKKIIHKGPYIII